MAQLTRYLLWVYVFTLSWDTVPLALVGSISRAVGLAVFTIAILTTMLHARFRRPDAVLVFAIAFGGWSALSSLWTISYEVTATRVFTYVQVVASAWLIREFVRTRKQVELLITAFCFGSFVPLMSLLRNFGAGVGTQETIRFTGSDLNPNGLGIQLVIGLPMAWHLLMHRRGIVRVVAIIYFALTPLSVLLTASRGAVLAGIVAFAIVPLTLPRQSLKPYAAAGVLLIVAIASTLIIVPRANWDRILTIPSEVTEGTMTHRTEIWRAGLRVYPQHPVVGFGADAYAVAVEPYLGYAIGSHNTALGLLVEEGIVGFGIFVAILGACSWSIFHSPSPYRALWGVVMLTWFVAAMDGNYEYLKITWMLFGLVSAQSGLMSTLSDARPLERGRSRTILSAPLAHPAHLSYREQT